MDNYSHTPYVLTFEQAVNEIANEVNKQHAFKCIDLQIIKDKSATLLKNNNIDSIKFSFIGWVTYKKDLVQMVSDDIMSNILGHLSKKNCFNKQIE